ncbi:hypothetical protein M426DRAFT_324544 [Hypoxylon sp. CI-4A]|nr:hypothetical protein M426DRAFT_324544 [Hypoxylon sp. CI-4A]
MEREDGSGPNKRRLLPLAPAPASASGQGGSAGAGSKGRRQVTAACEACRRRKSKCNAERPKCSLCVRHGTDCRYATAPTETHSQALKRKHSELQNQITPYQELFDLLKTKTESESLEILKRIRSGNNVDSIIRHAKDGDLLIQLSLAPESRRRYEFPYLSDMPASILLPDNLYLRSYVFETTFRAPPSHGFAGDWQRDGFGDERYLKPYHAAQNVDPSFSDVMVSKWTTVSTDEPLMRRLMNHYVMFQHPWTAGFHMDYFLKDMAAGRTRFCSSLLVNAVLAASCHMYRDFPDRNRYWLPRTLGYQFSAEAKRLWEIECRKKVVKLTTVQAAVVLNIVSILTAMDKVGTSYMLQAAAMATSMDLFSANTGTRDKRARKARAFTAWGLFCWQAWQRFYFTLPPLIPDPPAYPLPDPQVDPEFYGEVRIRYPGSQNVYPIHLGHIIKANFELRKLMNDMASELFEEGKPPRVTVEKTLECKSRMDNWLANLPEPLTPTKAVFPDHFKMHLEYYGNIILLVRFLIQSGVPLDLTWQGIITHAEVRLETLTRLYYLRHSFELYDPLLMHWLVFLGDTVLNKLEGRNSVAPTAAQMSVIPTTSMSATDFESLRSTLILCAKGLYEQGRNFHIGVLTYRLIRDRMKANDVDILRTHLFASSTSSSSSASSGSGNVVSDDDPPLMMEYVQADWLAPIVTAPTSDNDVAKQRTLNYLLKEYEKLSLEPSSGVEDLSEAGSTWDPISPAR